jgi:hypothetical protein
MSTMSVPTYSTRNREVNGRRGTRDPEDSATRCPRAPRCRSTSSSSSSRSRAESPCAPAGSHAAPTATACPCSGSEDDGCDGESSSWGWRGGLAGRVAGAAVGGAGGRVSQCCQARNRNCLEFTAKSNILQRKGRSIMRKRFSGSMLLIAIAVAAVSAVISTPIPRGSAQAPANSSAPPAPAMKNPVGRT